MVLYFCTHTHLFLSLSFGFSLFGFFSGQIQTRMPSNNMSRNRRKADPSRSWMETKSFPSPQEAHIILLRSSRKEAARTREDGKKKKKRTPRSVPIKKPFHREKKPKENVNGKKETTQPRPNTPASLKSYDIGKDRHLPSTRSHHCPLTPPPDAHKPNPPA